MLWRHERKVQAVIPIYKLLQAVRDRGTVRTGQQEAFQLGFPGAGKSKTSLSGGAGNLGDLGSVSVDAQPNNLRNLLVEFSKAL